MDPPERKKREGRRGDNGLRPSPTQPRRRSRPDLGDGSSRGQLLAQYQYLTEDGGVGGGSRRQMQQHPGDDPPHNQAGGFLEVHSVPLEDNHSRSSLSRSDRRGAGRRRRSLDAEDGPSISSPPMSGSFSHSSPRRRSSLSVDDLEAHFRATEMEMLEQSTHSMHSMDEQSARSGRGSTNYQHRRGRSGDSFASSNSLRSRGRSREDSFASSTSLHSHTDDGEDYLVGHSISSNSRRQRRMQSTDDASCASYGGLLDEESRDGRGDQWNMNKSVFSTLHQRIGRARRQQGDDSFFDDDDASTYSASSSFSHRQRNVSRSSSIASRMSQASQQSSQRSQSASSQTSFRFPRSNQPRSGNYEYDSDDSMGSLLGEYDEGPGRVPSVVGSGGGDVSYSDASSGSFLFNSKERGERSSSPTAEQRAIDFEDTLSHLESLGFGLELEREGDFASKNVASREGKVGDAAWWIEDLEAEGWFEHDTTTIFSGKVPPKRQPGTTDADADVHKELADARESSAVAVQQDTELDDTSTVDDDEGGGNWEERLWSLARTHYLEYRGAQSVGDHPDPSQSSSPEGSNVELEEQSVKEAEELYDLEYAAEQAGVLQFRSLLLACIETYVDAFHRKAGRSDDDSGASGGDQEWSDHPIDLRVYPHVPVPLARAFFLEVIAAVDRGEAPLDGLERSTEVTTTPERRAEVVASIIVDDTLNIFRRYLVITEKTSTKIGDETKKSRTRLNKATEKSSDAQAELEEYLYGEMVDEEKQGDRHITPIRLETKEHEIRIRASVLKGILGKPTSSDEEMARQCWAKSIICNVLLSNIKSIGGTVAGDAITDDRSTASSVYLQDQPMAQLYCVRYSPVFLLHALASHSGSSCGVSYGDLADLLMDEPYLLKRFELQGPFDATFTHLSNWQNAFFFRNNQERCNRDDYQEYMALHTAMVSALTSYLNTTLADTGFPGSEVDDDESGGTDQADDSQADKPDGDCITIHNYATIVATCLEIGRALHHLGVCLGRRQRDRQKFLVIEDGPANDTSDDEADADSTTTASATSIEITSYKKALKAYKAAIFVLATAERSALQSTKTELSMNGRQRSTTNGEARQEREALSTPRESSEARDGPNDELQVIREAKISVELHLADSLNILGFCHDKLSEYEESLMAYQESLSLYIRHVGRFHDMVSNALHNLGAVHVELSQWREAASCFRQCLAILKRKAKKDPIDPAQGGNASQMHITLQCLANTLAELGEYDASIACFQEIIDSSQEKDLESDNPSGQILSQMAGVHIRQASKLSWDINWHCHTLLFTDSQSTQVEELGFTLDQQLHVEHDAKECIKRSIHFNRLCCYATAKEEAEHASGIFSGGSQCDDSRSQFSANGTEPGLLKTASVSMGAPSSQIEALSKDLLSAGRLEFRSCSYEAALSYCWESFLLSCLVVARRSNDAAAIATITDLLTFDEALLQSEETHYDVPSSILGAVARGSPLADCAGTDAVQILCLIGVSYERCHDFEKAKVIFLKAKSLLASQAGSELDGTLEEAVHQLGVASISLRAGLVESELGNMGQAGSFYKDAIQVFNALSTHPIFSDQEATSEDSKGEVLSDPQLKELGMVRNNGLACALHRLGQTCASRGRPDKAMRCFDDSARILTELHDTRADFADRNSAPLLPSLCFGEEISAISTALILSDANEYSGRNSMGGDSDSFSLQCLERAIETREFIATISSSISAIDSESSLERFEAADIDKKNMDCLSVMLELIERRDLTKGGSSAEGEEKSWKGYTFGRSREVAPETSSADVGADQNDESLLTREDVLFRMGNLQMKLGSYRDAVISLKEAEERTIATLGTEEHAVVMNIKFNMANAYRALSLSSSAHESEAFKEQAVACYTNSIKISRACYGKQHATSAEALQNLASLYMNAGSACLDILNGEKGDEAGDERAYKLSKESLSIRRMVDGSQNELEMASAFHDLGNLCLRKVGYYYRCDDAEALKLVDDAMKYLTESLKIRKVLLEPDHITVGDVYQSIGVAHLNRALALRHDANKRDSETDKALHALTSALGIRRDSKNNKQPGISDEGRDSRLLQAHCLFYLGWVEETRSKHPQAKAHYSDALRMFQAEGKRSVEAMSKTSLVDEEGKLLMELEAIHLWTARVLYHMANIHRSTGSGEDAVSCYEEAIRIRSHCKSANPKKHGLNDALMHLNLAQALHDSGDYDKAIECYSYTLRSYLAAFGKDSPEVAETLTGMGKSFASMAIVEKAMQCYDKALRVYELRDSLAMKEKKGLLHREIAKMVQFLNGDVLDVLEHYRTSVSFLEEFNERRGAGNELSGQDFNKQLLQCYSEMLVILREVFDTERDKAVKAELSEEIGDVLHRMGNLHALFGQYEEAMSCFSEVLQAQRKANTDELRIADLLFNMGNIHLEQGAPENALECLRESYAITKDALGEDNANLHSTLYLMGVALANVEDFKGALKWLSRALAVLKSDDDGAVDEAAQGKTLLKIGDVQEKTGHQAKAIACLREAVENLKAAQGNELELSNALNSLGNLLRNASEMEQALDCYGQSLSLRVDIGNELLCANTKNNIGAVLSAMEEGDRAMAFSAQALRTKTERLGCDAIETARALVNMGQLYLDQKQHTIAEKYFQRGLRVFRAKMEDGHPDIGVCLHKLGVIGEALSDDEGALDFYGQSVHVFKCRELSEKSVTLAFSLHNAAVIHAKQNNLDMALELMLEALDTKLATFGDSHEETAASQHWLGRLYLELEDSEAALSHYKDALKTRVGLFGTEHIDVARTLFGLGQTHFHRSELEESIDCIAENLRVLRKFGKGGEELSQSELLLGGSHQELGQFESAIEHLSDALHMLMAAHGSDHLDVAQALFRLGICFCETNRFSESLVNFRECLDVRTKVLGNIHIECANTYESVGIVQQKSECHEDAIHSFERALAIKRTALEDDHEDVCVLLHFIGTSLFALERYADAVGYFSDSTERKKKHYGRTDPEYAMSVVDLAAALLKAGDVDRSMESYREAIESGGLPSDSWELGVAHKCLAGHFFKQRMYAASAESYGEATSIFEWHMNNAEGSEAKNRDVIQCYEDLLEIEDEGTCPMSEARSDLCYKLANCYVQANRHADAVSMYREAIMIQTQLHGADHLGVAHSLHNLGNCYRELCDFTRSEECLTRSLSVSTSTYEEENKEAADTCHCLALTLSSMCELEEAVALFERALTIRKKKLGALDLNTASTLYNLATTLARIGNWNTAMKHCKEALKIQRMTVGEDSPVTSRTLECMGRIHMDQREFEDALQYFSKCISSGNPKLQRECGIIYQLRGQSTKAQEMLMNAGVRAADQLGLSASQPDGVDLLDLTAKLQQRKQETSAKDLLGFANDVSYYGSVLLQLEKFSESLECFGLSNVIFQARYGPDHLALAENLHQTGCVLEKRSDDSELGEALESLTEALRIRKMHLVDCHPDLEDTLLCLGKVHRRLENTGDALRCFMGAVKARDTRLGKKHARMDDADALLQVAELHQQSGHLRQALDSFEECLDIKRQILDKDHPDVGELLFCIGNLLREVGALDLAQRKFEEALAIAEQVDPDSMQTASALFGLGVLHTEQKKYSLALDAFVGSLQIHKACGSSKAEIAELLNNIGITYSGMKEYERAQVYHAEALESLREELGDDHDDVAFCWHSLGVVHQELHDQTEALACFQAAVKIERTELYLQSLGICLVRMDDNENGYVCLDEAYRMKTLDSGADTDDDLAEIQRHLGIIWMRKEKFDAALKCFEDAMRIKALHGGDSDKDQTHLVHCIDGALEAVAELHGTDHMKYAKLLHQKGNLHGAKKEHSLAIEAYVEALRVYKGQHGDAHLSVANTLFNLGVALNAKGSPDKAIRCFTKALRITKATLGEDHLDVADTYEQVAESYKLLQQCDEATGYYEKALNIRKQAAGGSDLKSASIMHELGTIHSQEGRWQNAEKAFKESVRIRTMQLGQDDPLVAESMFSLGLVCKSRGDSATALKHLESSLRIYKSKLAGEDPQVAESYRSLGAVHSSLGDADKAIFCYDKATQIFTEVAGRESEGVALSLAGKGETLRSNDQLQDALSCYTECLRIRQSIDGSTPSEETGDVLRGMGGIYSELGDAANAASSFSSALSTYRQVFGAKHETVADVLQQMTAHFTKEKELERAYSCVKEALKLYKELLGRDGIKTGDAHSNMGTILFEWSDYSGASKCFERARDVHKQKLGGTHLKVADSSYYLGCICELKGDYKSAAKHFEDSLSGRREHLDGVHPEIADTLARLGHVYAKQSDWDQAAKQFADCLKIREATRGADATSQINVADALFDLGEALQKNLDTQRAMQLFADALKEYRHHLSPEDIKIAKCNSCMGEIYEGQNELAKAADDLESAARIYEHHTGMNPSDKEIKAAKDTDAYSGQAETLFRLATAKDRLGEEDAALKKYRKALRFYKALFGRDSLHVANILNRLANMKGRAGSVDKAMVLFDESLRIRMLHLGNDHEDCAEVLFGMGIVFEKRRDYGAAMKAYSDCLRIRSSTFGSDSMEVAQVVVNIGVVRGNKGDFIGALKSWNKALSIYRKNGLGDDDPLVATVLGHRRLANQLKKRRGRDKT